MITSPLLAPVLVSAPAVSIVTVDEAKQHARIDSDIEDSLIEAKIAAVVGYLDGWSGILGRCLINQTWRIDRPAFPACDWIRLPLAPVSSVSSVTYYDTSDASQTLATSAYSGPFPDAIGPYLRLKWGQTWPSTYERDDAVSVTFVAGYGAAASAVPAAIKAAALLMVGDLQEFRETAVMGVSSSDVRMSPTVDALLRPYRRVV